MAYAIQLTRNSKNFFGCRNWKGEWTEAMTAPEATFFKTEKGAWKSIQKISGDLASHGSACCWHDLLKNEGYEVNVVNISFDEIKLTTKLIVEPTAEPKLVELATETILQPRSNQLDLVEADTLEADHKQAYAQYIASQQEADALEAKLVVKKTEAQVYLAIMKEIDKQIEAKKREAEIITTAPAQPDFDVKTLEGKKVTLILVNTMGCPVCRHITIISADIVSTKRYQDDMTDKKCLQIQYVAKGKRKVVGTRYTEAELAISLGWQQIEVPNEFISFDHGLLDVIVRQAKDVIYTQ